MADGPSFDPDGLAPAAAGARSEAQERLLAESSPQIVWTSGPDGSPDFYNPPAEAYTGYRPTAGDPWGWLQLVHPADVERAKETWERSVATGAPLVIEYRLRRRVDGEYRWHAGRGWPIRGPRGEIVKWIGTATDVHDRVVEQAQANTTVLDFGEIVINLASREVTRRGELVELTRREFDLLSHLALEAGRTITRDHILEVAWSSSAQWQTAATITEHVRRLRLKLEDDHTHPRLIVTVRGTGYRFDPPEVTHADDLTESVAPSSVDPMLLLREADVLFANDAALALLGTADRSEVVGREAYDFIAPGSVVAAHQRVEVIRKGSWPRPELLTFTRLDGREVLVEVASAPVRWRGEVVSQVTIWPAEVSNADADADADADVTIARRIDDAVIVSNADFIIQSFNPAAEALYGWSEHEVLGHSVLEILPWAGEPRRATEAADVLRKHGRWHGHAAQLRRDGTTVVVASSVTLLCGAQGEPIGVVAINRPVLGHTSVDPGHPSDANVDTAVTPDEERPR